MSVRGAITSSLLTLAAILAFGTATGCSSTKDVDFAGSWTFTSGALNGTCLGMTIMNDLSAQTFTLEKGTTSDLLFTYNACVVKVNVDGKTASAVAGQNCMFNVPPIGPVTVAVDSWTMTSDDGGHTLTTSATGTAFGGTCPVTLNGAATKSAGGDASTGS